MLEYSAKEILINGDYTCVSVKGNQVYKSNLKGIMPIIGKLREDPSFFEGANLADVVIGKAAAMLLIYGKVGSIYTDLISEHAIEVLKKHLISFEYKKKVPYIMNRSRDGMCPMEQTVLDTEDIEDAYKRLLQKIS
ncbi:MAG: DUF1893 domain-containing protein [Anaerolineaceae bacterium]|nr:MAG: DUF1893 domain-containing protein [Anaerolineaceae bacterium]